MQGQKIEKQNNSIHIFQSILYLAFRSHKPSNSKYPTLLLLRQSAKSRNKIQSDLRRQICVATSTTEGEPHALSDAVKETVHLRETLDGLGKSIATTLFMDSQSCLAIATRYVSSAKTKHFAIRVSYVQETLKNRSIYLMVIASRDTCADSFTK